MANKKMRLGAYYPCESFMHSLDPRCKLIGLCVFIVGVFFANSFALFGLVYAFGFITILLSKIPFGKIFRTVRGILFLLLFTGVMNMIFTPGQEVLIDFGWFAITKEGVIQGGLMMLRLIGLILFSTLLTLTTTPIALADGIESLAKPLKKIHLPVHEFAMMLTIALRFIPILMEEADKIIKAQRSRGGDLGSGSIGKRLRGVIAIVVPLFFNALKRADDLAIAMEARCYQGGEGRTSIRKLTWHLRDVFALLAVTSLVICLAVFRFWL